MLIDKVQSFVSQKFIKKARNFVKIWLPWAVSAIEA